ncbi:unspecified product [Leishmania tarentolae]|uniref:Unspecified product n=1 Tax=Leishmania tarentolae TaxID=5689 RepID=A0A640KMJ1_LEITA|nr:unspecified product [Leishmania tarentolae]
MHAVHVRSLALAATVFDPPTLRRSPASPMPTDSVCVHCTLRSLRGLAPELVKWKALESVLAVTERPREGAEEALIGFWRGVDIRASACPRLDRFPNQIWEDIPVAWVRDKNGEHCIDLCPGDAHAQREIVQCRR